MVVQHDWPDAVKALIKRGCDVNAVDSRNFGNGARTGYSADPRTHLQAPQNRARVLMQNEKTMDRVAGGGRPREMVQGE